MIQRRKHLRVKIIGKIKVDVYSEPEGKQLSGYVADVSAGGIRVILTEPLVSDAKVKISFRLTPKLDFKDVGAVVARTGQLGSSYSVGLRMDRFDDEAQASLNDFVMSRRRYERTILV